MKAIGTSQEDVDTIIKAVGEILTRAIDEGRSIEFEMSRPVHEKPSSGSIQEYEVTGTTDIQIRVGLRGSALLLTTEKGKK